jgi:flagellar protein FliS
MGTSAQQAYIESRILSADPLELVQILYESALESVDKARRHLRNGDIAARSKEISKVCAILVELQGSVKHEAEPALAGNLVELYDYMGRRLIEANFHQADAPLGEVSRLLGTLLEGWLNCRPEAEPQEAAIAPAEDAAEYAGQAWTA